MKLFRNLSLATVAAFGVFGSSGFITNSTAEAHQTRYYYVYYRTCVHSPWQYYGAYDCPHNAQAAVNYIYSFGYETYVY